MGSKKLLLFCAIFENGIGWWARQTKPKPKIKWNFDHILRQN